MTQIMCPKCTNITKLSFVSPYLNVQTELKGVLTCSGGQEHQEPYSWPLTAMAGTQDVIITGTAEGLPVLDSQNLVKNVKNGIKQDVEEAERAYFFQLYKASVVMCRRAVQLTLEEKLGIPGLTLGPLLEKEREKEPHLLEDDTYSLAMRIKNYGDKGAHRLDELNPSTVATIIHDTVKVLNELYAKIATQ